ncbi:protein TASOR-like isoform 1-T1 [Synchiropus picturatus]
MSDAPARRGASRSRRVSAGAELGAKASVLDDDVVEVSSDKEGNRPALQGKKMVRRTSLPPLVHQRHMPPETKKFHIPRKTQENIDLLQFVSPGSREFENIMKVLTNNFLETNSSGCYSYSNPRVIHCKRLLDEFIEKRKEMKADGRTEKELEDSYCFLLTDSAKLPAQCERGMMVGASWLSLLGSPMKGIYLSKYSDLLHTNALSPGATGEILIFKVMKGKVKSIQENLKVVIDPTPRFDCHVSKNASNVTSLASFRSFELTQQYFYEYSFDELLQRPRQVCPYAVVSFKFLGKALPLTNNPLAPLRLNSHPSEAIKEPNQFTVWSGDLVKGNRVLYQIALCSSYPAILPRKLPEKLEIAVMRFDSLTRILPSELLSYKHYNESSKEVVKNGCCCSLLDVIDKGRSSTGVTRLLQELEDKRVVLVTPLTDRGFLFFLSIGQMTTPLESGEGCKRCLQALFVFPETTDGVQSSSPSCLSSPVPPLSNMKPVLHQFIPVLHYSLIKARANPPPELAVGVEQHAREYLAGQIGGKVRPYPMGEYDGDLDELGIPYPAPKHHRLTMEGYLSSYLYKPAFYQLSLNRACKLVEAHCNPVVATEDFGRHKETVGKVVADELSNTQKMQETIALVLAYKQKASNELKREEGKDGALIGPDRKRKLEQKTAERTIKYLKASQESLGSDKIPVDPGHNSALQTSLLSSLLDSVGLKDFGLREDGTEITANLVNLLADLKRSASEALSENSDELQEEERIEAFPFNKIALKLGLPTNCDIDLRKQDELEDQMADSNSSLEGFSPISLTGELNHKKGGRKKRKSEPYEEEEGETEWGIPWVLIPITGLCSGRYEQPDGNLPQDPRFRHRAMATDHTTAALPPRESPSPPLRPSPRAAASPCPSPEPSPPSSPLQCPSPEQSPPYSPSQWSSLEHHKHKSPPKSPRQSLSSPPLTDPARPSSPHRPPSLLHITPDPSSHQFTAHSNELHRPIQHTDGANEWHSNTAVFRDSTGTSKNQDPRLQRRRRQLEDSSTSANHVVSKRTTVRSLPDSDLDSDEGLMIISEETENEEETFDSVGGMRSDQTEEMEEEAQQLQGELEHQPEVTDRNENSNVETQETSSLCLRDVSTSSRDIGSILDKCQVDFNLSVQHLLQSKNVVYTAEHVPIRERFSSFPQLSHCALLPCPDAKVEHYVNSLQQSIMKEFDVSWPGVTPQSDQRETLLASRVSEFVENIRASTCVANGSQGAAHLVKDDGASGHVPSDVPAKLSPSTSVTSSTTFNSQLYDYCQADGDPLASSMLTADVCVPPDSSGRIILPSTSTAVDRVGSKEACQPFSQPLMEPSQSSERVPTPDLVPLGAVREPAEEPAPLSSLISRLQPDLLSNLLEIVKDIKRNTPQFYMHCFTPEDEVVRDIKEFLLRQGCVEQSPVMFINQGNSDTRLLVIIRNKDISVHVHKIPGLVALKRHRSVQFVGVDSLANIRDSIWNEIFVCGGCIISDDLVLNPDFIEHERLAELLMFLEKQSSPQSIWRWKVHSKTHKKLKEQARFRRDAAKLLEVVSVFQTRQIIELLPDHHCDKSPDSPDLDCLLELQGRYTKFRHTIFLIEHRSVNFAAYFSKGIIVANFNDVLENFTQLVGYHDIKEKLFIMEDLLSAKDLNQPDPASCDAPDPPEESSSSHSPAPDPLAADGPYGDLNPSESDLEILHQAISHLRAERQAQKERQHQSETLINSGTSPSSTFPQRGTDDVSPDESHHLDPNTKGVMDTLNSIHMILNNPETQTTRTEPDPPDPVDMLEAKHCHQSAFLSSSSPPSSEPDFIPETCDSTQDAAREVPSTTSSVPATKDGIGDLQCDPVLSSCVKSATSDTVASPSPSKNISSSTCSQQQIPRLEHQYRHPRSKGFSNPVSLYSRQRLPTSPVQHPTVAMYRHALGMSMAAQSSWMNSSLWQQGLIPTSSSAMLWPSPPNVGNLGRMGFHPRYPPNYQNQSWQGGRFNGM